jgi:hypothetical protein
MRRLLLQRELKRAGADSREAADLAGLAEDLQRLAPRLDPERKCAIAVELGMREPRFTFSRSLAIAGALGVLLVVGGLAQFAQPGSPLYSVKQGTNKVRAFLQPGYHDEAQRPKPTMNTNQEMLRKVEESPAASSTASQSQPAPGNAASSNADASGNNRRGDSPGPNLQTGDSPGSGPANSNGSDAKFSSPLTTSDNSGTEDKPRGGLIKGLLNTLF